MRPKVLLTNLFPGKTLDWWTAECLHHDVWANSKVAKLDDQWRWQLVLQSSVLPDGISTGISAIIQQTDFFGPDLSDAHHHNWFHFGDYGQQSLFQVMAFMLISFGADINYYSSVHFLHTVGPRGYEDISCIF